ncbi:hypothetical protein QR680_008942 [Steinernema hermaphroditum]|uniref:Secreted protein n=1 Tax=Steinernema hermaphroditum TaxID=289476 RepID=A0AA39M913_9BILA|nr:hypothetical protein QR680_008942 [Steinernema hermaphroditum]
MVSTAESKSPIKARNDPPKASTPMTAKLLLVATLLPLLAVAVAAPSKEQCDCKSLSQSIQESVVEILRFLSDLAFGVTRVAGCSLNEVLQVVVHLIYTLLHLLSSVLNLPLPPLATEPPFSVHCAGLDGIVNSFLQLVQKLLSNAGIANSCGCQVPILGNLVTMIVNLLNIVRGLLGGLLGGVFQEPIGHSAVGSLTEFLQAH